MGNVMQQRSEHDETGGAPTMPLPGRTTGRLRMLLVALDAVALFTAWAIGLSTIDQHVGPSLIPSLALAAAITVVGIAIMRSLELYLARTSAIRSAEFSRIVKAVLLTGGAALIGMRIAGITFRVPELILGTALSFVFVLALRSGYRAWIGLQRRNGRHTRDIIVVGAGPDAAELIDVLEEHSDAGYRIVGVVGRHADAVANGLLGLWFGTSDQACRAVHELGANGAVIALPSVEPEFVDRVTRDLLANGAHVHLSTGVRGIDSRRLRSLPLGYEPLLYVEPATLSKAAIAGKRVVDIVVSGLALLVLSPLMLAIAFLIRHQDKGRALFTQVRVGRGGETFRVYKFRTMVPNAEALRAALEARNERSEGLFKMEDDPRVTRIGHFLRDSSLDELPQLINVLKGEMSLVGPRPALPSEVATFDDRLLARNRVRPGITGLWQVEARDNPSFGAYRRLDLYYVDNWSPFLDVMIALGTVEQVIARMLRLVLRRRHSVAAAEVPAPAAEAA